MSLKKAREHMFAYFDTVITFILKSVISYASGHVKWRNYTIAMSFSFNNMN